MRQRLVHPTTLATMVIALGFALRLFRLDAQSLWYDEAFSAEVAEKPVSQIIAGEFGDNHPPFHSIALHYWGLVGRSDFLLRFLSTMAGTLGIAAIYALGRSVFGPRAGLLAAAITALAPYHLFYSQELRLYSTLFLATAFFLLSYVRAVRTDSRRWWTACACSAICGMYVQYWIAFVLLGVHFDLLQRRSKWQVGWPRLALVDLAVLLAFAPWLRVFVERARVIASGQFWLAKPGIGQLLSAPYGFTLNSLVNAKVVRFAFAVVLLLFIATHLQIARELARRGKDSAGLPTLLSAFWSPLLLTFIISQWRSVYVERTLIVAVPALYVMLGWAAARTKERYVNLALLIVVGLFAANGLNNWYFNADFGKPPFRAVALYLQSAATPEEPILHANDTSLLTFMHYNPAQAHWLLQGDPILNLPVAAYRSFGGDITTREEIAFPRFWLVLALDSSIEYQRDLVEWFDRHHTLSRSYDAGGIFLRRYDDGQ